MTPDILAVIEQLYQKEYAKMYSYALAVLADPEYAEDTVQDTFFEAIRHTDTLKDHPNIIGWLMSTLKNKIRKAQTAKSKQLLRFASIEEEKAQLAADNRDMEIVLMQKECSINAIKAILKPDDFLLLKRISIDEADITTVANEFGISVPACYKRLSRIRKQLREKFPNILG